MIRNYLKIAWRNLKKNLGFTFINVFGLSVGVAACLLISVYILHESSYDKDVENAGNIYRIISSFQNEGQEQWGTSFSANTAPTILREFDEVVNAGRIMDNNLFDGAGSNEVSLEGQTRQFHEEGFAYADPSILEIMDIQMAYGTNSTALSLPNSVVISESVSKKFFGSQNPVGSVIYLNGKRDAPRTIGGVMKDFPSNSHISYDYFLTLTGKEFGEGEQNRWYQMNYITYLVLRPDTDISTLENKLNQIIIGKYMKSAFKDNGLVLWETIEEKAHLQLQPLADIHLHSGMINAEAGASDIKIIWIFGIVAAFILVIASINFVNLSTARSANRAKEVGLRKVVGSDRKGLIMQFLTESVLVSVIAFLIGSLIALIFLPAFRNMTAIDLSIPWKDPVFLLAILLTSLLVGLLAGIYPSFYLSRFNPVNVLKGKLRMGSRSGGLRSGLVVFQFTVSIILIIGTLIVSRQLNFILTSKVGFDKDQVIQIYGTNMLGDQVKTFKESLEGLSGVASVSISDYLPVEGTKRNGNGIVNEGRDKIDESVLTQAWLVDEDYLATLGITLKEGRNFDEKLASDEKSVIINEEMARKLNLDSPIGERISRFGDNYQIIGVVKDFNFDSMTDKVRPLALFRGESPSIISVKANSADVQKTLASIEDEWSTFAPDLTFRYAFMDQTFARMYDNLSRIRSIFITFAVLALVVACLGLFALSAYLVEQRSKEMSIRKVLGASFQSIFQILTKNFVSLVLISMLIAVPIAYYLMQTWLQDYEYRIDLHWTVFALAGVLSILIAVGTVSYHSIRAALINPVENLKGE